MSDYFFDYGSFDNGGAISSYSVWSECTYGASTESQDYPVPWVYYHDLFEALPNIMYSVLDLDTDYSVKGKSFLNIK